MKVTCKTLETSQKLSFLMESHATLFELVERLKSELGKDNEYTLICLGKIMNNPSEKLCSVCHSETLPIIVKVQTPTQRADEEMESR